MQLKEHAEFSPSSAHKWVNCLASYFHEKEYLNEGTFATIDGTGTHLLLEMMLKDEEIGDVIGVNHPLKPKGWEVTKERYYRAKEAYDYIVSQDYNRIYIEQRVEPFSWTKFELDCFGTSDVVLIKDNEIEIIDYKDGGVKVDVKDNLQLILYMLGAVFLDFSKKELSEGWTFKTTVIQPKVFPSIQSYIYSYKELEDMYSKILEAIIMIKNDFKDYSIGKWCKFCKHRDNCIERKGDILKDVPKLEYRSEKLTEVIESTIEILKKPMSEISNEEVSKVLEMERLLTPFFDHVKEEAVVRLNNKETIPNYYLTPGRSKRNWRKPEKEISKILIEKGLSQEEIYEVKLKSPAALLKLFEKSIQKELESEVEKVEGELTLKRNDELSIFEGI